MKKTVNIYQEFRPVPHNQNYAQIANSQPNPPQIQHSSPFPHITGSNTRPQTPQSCPQYRTQTAQNTPSQALIKKSLQQSQTKASKQQSNISSSPTNKFLQLTELQIQIQKLNIQQNQKNKQIRYLQKTNQKRKAEIVQLEKNVSYYEGRLSMMEDQLVKYEGVFSKIGKQCDERSKYKSQVQELVQLFEGLRKQNEAANGRYEQKCYQLTKLTQKYLKLKNKIKQQRLLKKSPHKLQKNQQTTIPRKNSASNTKINKRVYELGQQQKERQHTIKSLNIKIHQIQAKIIQISKQNQRLFDDLQQRQQTISKLQKQLQYFKHGRSDKSIQKSSSMRRHYKKRLHSLILPQPVQTNTINQYQIFKPTNSSGSQQKPMSILNKNINMQYVFRKLKFNLMAEDIDYETIVQKICSGQEQFQYFMRAPFGLNCAEAEALVEWVRAVELPNGWSKESLANNQMRKQIISKAIRKIFPKYKLLNIKQLYQSKTNIYNAFQNRLYESLTQNNLSKTVRYNEIEKMLREEWGFKEEQIDVVMKGYFQYTGQIEWINLITLGDVVEKWYNL